MNESYVRRLSYDIDRAKNVLAAFKEDLDNNPVYAFRHSDASFYAAARLQVYNYCLGRIQNVIQPITLSALREYVDNQIKICVRNPVRSTCQTDVFVGTALLSAWSDVAELFAL